MKHGILLIHKPIKSTSFDCIRHLKKMLPNGTKIGHTGTLDPFASGLLIVCIGREVTKLVPSFMELPKTYRARGTLGVLTDTLDSTGTIIDKQIIPANITKNTLQESVASLMPQYEQIPPLYSALKHNGVPLHRLARTHKLSYEKMHAIAQRKSRIVSLYAATIESYEPPTFTLKVIVSKGTYIRTLMNDIAQKCNTIATTSSLEREVIGPYHVHAAHTLASLQTAEQIYNCLVTPDISSLHPSSATD